jgi:hypothetical protein
VKGRLLCTKVIEGVRGVVMVLNATFKNISVISLWSVLLVDRRKPEYPEKTTNLPHFTDKRLTFTNLAKSKT